MVSLRQKAIKGVAWSAIQNWGSNLISLGVFVVLARLLDAQAFGLVALASTFTLFLEIFLRQGFGQALVQRADLQPGHLDTAFWINVLSGLVLAGVAVVGAQLIAMLYHEPRLTPVIHWLALTILIGSFSQTQASILRRRLAFKSLAGRSLISSLAGGLVGVGMALAGYGVWSLVGQSLAKSLVSVAVLWRASPWRPGLKVSRRHAKELFSFGINVLGIELLGFLNRRSDGLLIFYFLGPVALGYYTVAFGVVMRITRMLKHSVAAVSLPTFSRLQHSPDQMRHAFLTAVRMTSLIAFPAFLGISVLAPELVKGFFGTKWQESIPVLRFLAFIGILHSANFTGAVVMALGKPSWILGLNSLNVVVHLMAIVVAVQWGIVAVAAAYVLAGYLLLPIHFLMIRKPLHLSLGDYLRPYAAPLAGSLVMVAAVIGIRHLVGGWMDLRASMAVCILTGVAAYVLFIRLLAPAPLRQALEFVRIAAPDRWKKEG